MAKVIIEGYWEALLPEEQIWLVEHQERCSNCGHLSFIHAHEEWGEVVVCDIENCNCGAAHGY